MANLKSSKKDIIRSKRNHDRNKHLKTSLKSSLKTALNAISENNEVYIVNNGNELVSRQLSILKKYSDFVIVKDGLKAGERIVISKLSTASNGIKVNPVYK